MRHKSKFYLVWGLLLGLAVFGSGLEYLRNFGFTDLNAFAEFVMPSVVGMGFVSIISICFISPASLSPEKTFKGMLGSIRFKRTVGVKRCFNCKKILEDSTGARCQHCHWIRCQCGACNCGRGSMV